MFSSMDAAVTIGILYLMVNIASFVVFYLDKMAAVRLTRRIPEKTLLIIALVGPIGAVGGIRIFHHKTRKTKFLLAYVFLALHILLFAYILVPIAVKGLESLFA